MLLLDPMNQTARLFPKCPNYWVFSLHLFYAALFAVVLPFICFGALGTPGHPHALPHLVFLAPVMSKAMGDTSSGGGQMLAVHAEHLLCSSAGVHALHTHQGMPQPLPAGRSSPPILAVASLLILQLFTCRRHCQSTPSFLVWCSDPLLVAPTLSVIVPPPR